MGKYFLVDFENVSDDGLVGFEELSPRDTVIVLYTDKACKIRVDFVEALNAGKSKAPFQFMKVASGNQALDMQLATFLGSMIPGERDGAEFVIVSKDKGYNHIIQFWKNREPGIEIALKKSIRDAIRGTDPEESEAEPKPAEPKSAPKKPAANRKNAKAQQPVKPKETPALPPKKPEETPAVKENNGNPQAPKPEQKENGGKGQEKTRLNAAVQHLLSEAKYDTAVISFVASLAVKLYGTENSKRSTYTGIIRQYGQKEGLKIYNLIKKEL